MATSQKDQIQALITDIEQALGKERPKTPWVKTSETQPQREALARAQAYLMSLQQSFDAPGGWGPVDPTTGQIATQPTAPAASAPASDTSADNVLQALLTEMKFLKSSALEPLRLEMDTLREERDRLNEEVKVLAEQRNQVQLETQQAQLALAQQASNAPAVTAQAVDEEQLNQFLQALMARLQESLSAQVTGTLSQLESEHSAAMAKLTAATEIEILELKPTEQIEEMRQLQSRSDQLLANIDSTLQRMFETLQTNIDSYQISLNEGIENMHSLGRQGEVIVRSLVDHLTQQLGQTASPEPAFYPNRANTLADATDYTAEYSSEPTADTVSSLNEILPAAISDTASPASPTAVEPRTDAAPLTDTLTVNNGATETTETSTDGIAHLSDVPETLTVDSTNEEPKDDPENFIREDGTIDLDLLKLDIDRTKDDPSLSRDDMMIDSSVADAEIAARESDNADIEDKVIPTANAAFLAGLTFDDLVVDTATPVETAPEPELAEVLPDLSFEDNETDRDDTDENTDGDTANASDSAADESTPTDAEPLDGEPIIESVTESDVSDVDVSNAEASETRAAEATEEKDTEEEAQKEDTEETDEEGKPESAFVPDLPEGEEYSDASPSALSDDQTNDKSIDPVAAQDIDQVDSHELINNEEIDDALSDNLIAVIEEANAEAERTAIESMDDELEELTSDLEEAIVSDTDLPPLSILEESATSLESASIPDVPDGISSTSPEATQSSPDAEQPSETDVPLSSTSSPEDTPLPDQADSLEASLTDSLTDVDGTETADDNVVADSSTFDELEELINDDATETDSPIEAADSEASAQAVTEIPPVDFDDDLDFFQADDSKPSDPIADAQTTEADADSTAELPTAAAGVAGAVGVAAVAKGLASPSEDSDAQPADESSEKTDEFVQTQGPSDDTGDDDPTGGEPADWFLGIDFGATGLSAVLINQRGEQVYPLCWNVPGDSEDNRFRLPTVVQLNEQSPRDYTLGKVGPIALQQPTPLLRNLKLMAKAGIPDDTASTPWMQWADHVALPLVGLQSAVVDLLKTLSADQMSAQAVGLTASALRRALGDLKGVVVGYPTNWPDTYSFNLREAVLSAGLVSSPNQVFFVEEAIAALLSALPAPQIANDIPENQQPGLYNCNWSGGTVVISAGAILTETAVANLPSELEQLSYKDFAMRGYTYAGDSIDQDIICQLLHLPLQAQDGESEESVDSSSQWDSLGLNELSLPQPGEADRVVRHRLRQRLNDSPLGREAVLAARELKVALQEEEEVEVELGDHTWIVTRKDLETKVFLPYIQRINRQVNALLSKQNLAAQNVKQVVCTGGSASLGAIARWLRQKFPNATIIQDTYSGEYSNSCSRVAYGLANLCHYPKVLDSNRHQYNDYFLLLELLRILPEQPLPAGGILHLLEQRGINTQSCQAHVLALIEGHLPPGLVPTSGDRPLISAQSSDIATYKTLSELPLFRKQGGQIYIADTQQGEKLRSHLEKLLSTKSQSLSEPMTTTQLTAAGV